MPLGEGFYEGYFDDIFGKCFCPLLIDRINFGSQHSGSYQFDVGQRSAKESQILDCVSPSKDRVKLRFFTLNDPFVG